MRSFHDTILQNLNRPRGTLSPGFLCSGHKSRLFSTVYRLPRCCLAHARVTVLDTRARSVTHTLGRQILIRLNDNDDRGVHVLLQTTPRMRACIKISVSQRRLRRSYLTLVRSFSNLRAVTLYTSCARPLPLSRIPRLCRQPALKFFPKSSVNGLRPTRTIAFLGAITKLKRLVIKMSLGGSTTVLRPTCSSTRKISTTFTLGLLDHVGQRLKTGFSLHRFACRTRCGRTTKQVRVTVIDRYSRAIRINSETFSFIRNRALHARRSCGCAIRRFRLLTVRTKFRPIRI